MPPHEDAVIVGTDHNMVESSLNDHVKEGQVQQDGQPIKKEEISSSEPFDIVTEHNANPDLNHHPKNAVDTPSTSTTTVVQESNHDKEYHPETNENRPSIITVTIFKETKETKLGIGLEEFQEEEEEDLEVEEDNDKVNKAQVQDNADKNEKDNESSQVETSETDTAKSTTKATTRTKTTKKTTSRVKIIAMTTDGLVSQTTPLQVGDIIERVNNVKCTNYGPTLQRLRDAVGTLTIQISNPDGHPNLIQSTFDPKSSLNSNALVFESMNVQSPPPPTATDTDTASKKDNDDDNNKDDTTKEADVVSTDNGEEENTEADTSTQNNTNNDNNDSNHDVEPKNDNDNDTTMMNHVLCIKRIPGTVFFSKCGLKPGDRVLSINAIPCNHLLPDEAHELIQELVSKQTIVDIVVMRLTPAATAVPAATTNSRAQQLLKGARRAGVAVGGGALVGVGLVFIPTLPPPFGEVLIVGGVSLLGTEFEAPKRVVRGARESLARAVGPEDQENEEGKVEHQEQQGEEDEGITTTAAEADSDNDTNAAAAAAASINITEQDEHAKNEQDPQTTSIVASRSDSGISKGEEETNIDETQPTDNNTNKVPMKTRFKNFGRRVVIPFLDQLVGDQEEEKEAAAAGKADETKQEENENKKSETTTTDDYTISSGVTSTASTDEGNVQSNTDLSSEPNN